MKRALWTRRKCEGCGQGVHRAHSIPRASQSPVSMHCQCVGPQCLSYFGWRETPRGGKGCWNKLATRLKTRGLRAGRQHNVGCAHSRIQPSESFSQTSFSPLPTPTLPVGVRTCLITDRALVAKGMKGTSGGSQLWVGLTLVFCTNQTFQHHGDNGDHLV